MKGAHGEPWVVVGAVEDGGCIASIYPHDDDTGTIADCYGVGNETADARAVRIASCVNALDGIEDPAGTLAEVRFILDGIAHLAAGAPAMEARRALSLLTPKV